MNIKLLLWLVTICFASQVHALSPGVKLYQKPIKAPDFVLTDTNDNIHRLADYRDRVLIINFWATWCTPCRKEMPSLKQAWKKLKQENIQLLGIATKDSKEAVIFYQNENSIEFPLPIDENGYVADNWAVMVVPTAYIIDLNGHIVMRIVGSNEWNNPKLIDSIIALKNRVGIKSNN